MSKAPKMILLSRLARPLNFAGMRPVLTAFFVCVAALTSARAAELEFVRVWPAWREAESFKRLSEYFTDRENSGGQTLLRTHPEVRAGYYFLVRLKRGTTAPAGAKFVLTLITPDAPEAKTFTFPLTTAAGGIFQLGLTGSDWTDRKAHPVAWKLELIAQGGRMLAEAQSFLWALPAL